MTLIIIISIILQDNFKKEIHLEWVQLIFVAELSSQRPETKTNLAVSWLGMELKRKPRTLRETWASECPRRSFSNIHTRTHVYPLSLIRLIVSTQRGKREVGVQGLTAISWPHSKLITLRPSLAGWWERVCVNKCWLWRRRMLLASHAVSYCNFE